MKTVYKVTDDNYETRYGTKWGYGVTNVISQYYQISNPELCSETVIHAYPDIRLAALLYHAHVSWINPVLWEAITPKIVVSDNNKIGVHELTTVRRIAFPKFPVSMLRRLLGLVTLQSATSSDKKLIKHWLEDSAKAPPPPNNTTSYVYDDFVSGLKPFDHRYLADRLVYVPRPLKLLEKAYDT